MKNLNLNFVFWLSLLTAIATTIIEFLKNYNIV